MGDVRQMVFKQVKVHYGVVFASGFVDGSGGAIFFEVKYIHVNLETMLEVRYLVERHAFEFLGICGDLLGEEGLF
jgi:hypothetical protein